MSQESTGEGNLTRSVPHDVAARRRRNPKPSLLWHLAPVLDGGTPSGKEGWGVRGEVPFPPPVP